MNGTETIPKLRLGLAASLLMFALACSAQTAPPFRIGLNFPFVGAAAVNVSNTFTNITPLGLIGMRHSTPADVNWLSIQSNATAQMNFTTADQVFSNNHGVIPIGTLYEDPNGGTLTPGLQVPWIAGSGFSFTSSELYYASNYVRAVVSRYAGVTHLWEVSNEVSGQTNRPKSLPPDAFASFLVTNRAWIHAADAQAQVLLPGCLGNYGLPFTNSYIWLRQVLTSLNSLGSPGFDVMNYHDYKSWWVLPADFDGYRAVLAEFNLTNMPIWITECSSASTNTTASPPYASEDQQAADVWRRSCLLFGKGASAWFWHSLYSSTNANGFAYQGLLTPGSANPSGQKKKSWHAFKLLVQKIEGFQNATLLQLGSATGDNNSGGQGQWAVRFDWPDGTRRFIAWSGTNLDCTLTNLSANPHRITTVVPATLSSDGETAMFVIVTNTPVAGALRLTGTSLPVLVESTVPAAPAFTRTAQTPAAVTFSGTGPTAETYHAFATTNLALPFSNWTQISSGTFSNSTFQFSDAPATNFARRFYRLSVP